MTRVGTRGKSFLVVVIPAALGAMVGLAQQPRRVNDDLLKTGSKTGDEWVSYGVNWGEQRFSPLKEIDASNVSRLGLAWSTELPLAPGNPQTHQENTPLVFNGVLAVVGVVAIAADRPLLSHQKPLQSPRTTLRFLRNLPHRRLRCRKSDPMV